MRLVLDAGDGTNQMLDMLLAKKRAGDRKSWLEEKGDLAEVVAWNQAVHDAMLAELREARRTGAEAEAILDGHPLGTPIAFDIEREPERLESLVAEHDLAVSLLPWVYHPMVAKACLAHGKHMVTTSYVKDEMKALDGAAKKAGVVLLNELGVDPGPRGATRDPDPGPAAAALPETFSLHLADWDRTISFRTSAEPLLNLEVFDALACGELALGVLRLDALGPASEPGRRAHVVQLLDDVLHRRLVVSDAERGVASCTDPRCSAAAGEGEQARDRAAGGHRAFGDRAGDRIVLAPHRRMAFETRAQRTIDLRLHRRERLCPAARGERAVARRRRRLRAARHGLRRLRQDQPPQCRFRYRKPTPRASCALWSPRSRRPSAAM